jgi:hypothetical protein
VERRSLSEEEKGRGERLGWRNYRELRSFLVDKSLSRQSPEFGELLLLLTFGTQLRFVSEFLDNAGKGWSAPAADAEESARIEIPRRTPRLTKSRWNYRYFNLA